MSETALQKIEPAAGPVTPRGETAVVLNMIERLLERPDLPIEKLEQMFSLHQRVQADAARKEFTAALSAMQEDMPTIAERGAITLDEKRDGNKTGAKVKQSTYALWEDVNEQIRPVLTKHGFALTFRIEQPPSRESVSVTAVLSHAKGHIEQTTFSLPIENSGSKNNVQGWGSSVSYGKRYTAFALLNIASRGEDDDGQRAGDEPSQITADELRKLITDSKSDAAWFHQHYSVETLDDLTGKQRAEMKSKLNAKIANMRRKVNG